jgi:sulfite reductase (NADPH) hemoprotein beta-component
MAASDDPRTLGRTRLSFADESEADDFVRTLDAFEKGAIGSDEWRAYRLLRGNYGQRQDSDAHMLRVKIPQGVLSAGQLHAIADVAERHSRGFGHVTTRQNVQLHFVKLHEVEAAMRRVAEAGLTTREACGNSVRNVTACPLAGVAADEVFDVTPYAEALTRYFLRRPLSSSLPRKFKIAFEGCPDDHVLAAINDIGWRAHVREGRRGFRVTVGGGTSILCRSGALLHEFLPAGEVLESAEAVLRVFQRLGDYEHRQRNRMKFLIKELGWERWKAEYDKELAAVRAGQRIGLDFDPESPPVEEAPSWPRPAPPSTEEAAARAREARVQGPGLGPRLRPALPVLGEEYEHWRRTNVRPQKQAGLAVVTATLPLGDVTGAQMRLAADLALAYGDGSVRVSVEQDLLFRWVRASDVPEVYRRLAAAGLGLPDAGTVADVTSCPGAESCRLAVTHSRGLGRLLGDHLRARPDLVRTAEDLQVKISGCPNGCGQHHVAGIGFQGSVRKLGDRVVPQYFVQLGGGVDRDGAHFGRIAAKIPARRVAEALERLLECYGRERGAGESAADYFRRVELAGVKAMLADLEALDAGDAEDADFVDLGEDAEAVAEPGQSTRFMTSAATPPSSRVSRAPRPFSRSKTT